MDLSPSISIFSFGIFASTFNASIIFPSFNTFMLDELIFISSENEFFKNIPNIIKINNKFLYFIDFNYS